MSSHIAAALSVPSRFGTAFHPGNSDGLCGTPNHQFGNRQTLSEFRQSSFETQVVWGFDVGQERLDPLVRENCSKGCLANRQRYRVKSMREPRTGPQHWISARTT